MTNSEDETSSKLQTVQDNEIYCVYDSCMSGDAFEDEKLNQNSSHQSSNSSKSSNSENSCDKNTNGDSTENVYDINSDISNDIMEILEENNNDPNNNVGDENNESHVRVVNNEFSSSTQPGCSRTFDVIENCSNTTDIYQLAQKILGQISKITHESIVVAIKKAKLDKNKSRISLSELLPVTQNRNDHSYTCLVNRKNVTPDETSSRSSSPIQVESLLSKTYVDIIKTENSSDSVNRPNVVQSPYNHNVNYVKPVSSCIPVLNVIPNVALNLPSTSKQNGYTAPSILSLHSVKPLVKLPDSDSNQRKVYVCEDHDGNNIYNDTFTLQQTKCKSNCEQQNNKLSNQPSTLVIRKHQHYHTKYQKQNLMYKWNTEVAQKCFESSVNTLQNSKSYVSKVNNFELVNQLREFEAICARIQKQKGNEKKMEIETTVNSLRSLQSISVQLPQSVSLQTQSQALNNYPNHSSQRFMEYRDPAIPGPSNRKADNEQTVCIEIYYKLRAIFPDLKREYIEKFCPSNWTTGLEHGVQVSNIVDKILSEEPLWEYDFNINQMIKAPGADCTSAKNDLPNIEETYEYLAGVFPDADPHYLREVATKLKDENVIKEFVARHLDKPDYPTRQQYLEKLKITQEQERYTINFNVVDFVKIFPNPFSYFEDSKRKCLFNIVCLEFLKAIHNRIRIRIISATYTECHYNMSLTTKTLKLCNEEMKTRRASREIPTSNIPMLQEMAFIRHQDAIKKYIDQIQSDELEEFNNLKNQGKLLICQCCYDDECMPSKSSKCENGHIFCNSCIISGTDSKLSDGEAHVQCFLACGGEFSLSTLQTVLLPTKFSILLKKRQTEEVMAAGLEGLVSCPFCHFASIPADGDKIFKCLNPECMKESCIKCKEHNHVPLQCHEGDKTDKARKYIEEKMTQALARTCYNCKRSFFKEEGCNKITCPCGAIMCYLCDKPIKNYSHFAGQGSDGKNKCPLWTDNKRLNAETVRKVAEVAHSELLREDPTLIINTDRLKPELPPSTNGPHTDIAGAQNIAVQLVARVMKENRG